MKSAINLLLCTFLFFSSYAQQHKTTVKSSEKEYTEREFPNKIIGTWVVTSMIEADNGKRDTTYPSNMSTIFYSNGEYEGIEGEEKEKTKGKYKIEGSVLTTDYDQDEKFTSTIAKLTDTELVLYLKLNYLGDDYESWIQFKKQP